MKIEVNGETMNVYIVHARRFNFNPNEERLKNTGGLTFAFSLVDDTVFVGYARCSKKDQYCKKIGREMAIGRLLESPVSYKLSDMHETYEDFIEDYVSSVRMEYGY